MTERDACDTFKPDPEHINALPDPLRRHIHDLETRADRAGDIQEIASLTEQRDALVISRRELEARVVELQEGVSTLAAAAVDHGDQIRALNLRLGQLFDATNAEVEKRGTAERERDQGQALVKTVARRCAEIVREHADKNHGGVPTGAAALAYHQIRKEFPV